MFTERSDPQTFAGLVDRQALDPWRLESDALFVELVDIAGKGSGLDLRIGRQQIIWGTADKFHPVSNLNALDVEDALLFGAVVANEMISLRYRPGVSAGDEDSPWFDELSFEVVFVPFFKPAQLPNSAGLAFTDQAELERQAKTVELRKLIQAQKDVSNLFTFSYSPEVVLPAKEGANSMVGARLGWRLLGIDMGFSYFYGFDGFPRAEKVIVNVDGTRADSAIRLTYPRKHVFGIDMATSLDFLGGVGLWAEVAVVAHDNLYRFIDPRPILAAPVLEKEHDGGVFVKAVVGIDYTFGSRWYVNIQYMHGFVDEFGQRNLGDYLVAGSEIKFPKDIISLRLFTILDFDTFSYVVYPQLTATPWSGAELAVGGFLFLGTPDSKFGAKIAGRSTVFFKATYRF